MRMPQTQPLLSTRLLRHVLLPLALTWLVQLAAFLVLAGPMALLPGVKNIIAVASGNIRLRELTGDFSLRQITSTGGLVAISTPNSVIDALNDDTVDITAANGIQITATSGSIGDSGNLEIDMTGTGVVTATAAGSRRCRDDRTFWRQRRWRGADAARSSPSGERTGPDPGGRRPRQARARPRRPALRRPDR